MRRIFYVGILLVAGTAVAQQAGIGFTVGIPRNEFREATNAEGYGLNLTALFGNGPVNLGFQTDYQIYGLLYRNYDLYADIYAGNTVIDRIWIPVTVVNTNSIFGLHANLRVTTPTKDVRAYFEGLFGFRYISTSTRIEDNTWNNRYSDPDDDVIVRKTNLADIVLSYGGGGGLQFRLNKSSYLDLRAYYLRGGKAYFYDGDDTKKWRVTFSGDPETYDPDTVDGGDLSFDASPKYSTTDMLMLQLGIVFKL
jgi:hypothetical protein